MEYYKEYTNQIRPFFTAIIVQAVKDLFEADILIREDAKQFLLSEECRKYCKIIGFNSNIFHKVDLDKPEECIDLEALKHGLEYADTESSRVYKPNLELGTRLCTIRKSKGIGLKKVEQAIDVRMSAISRWERGILGLPDEKVMLYEKFLRRC